MQVMPEALYFHSLMVQNQKLHLIFEKKIVVVVKIQTVASGSILPVTMTTCFDQYYL